MNSWRRNFEISKEMIFNQNAVVLITGCSSGIGHALAGEFKSRNFKVYALDRNLPGMSDLKDRGIITIQLDINNREKVDQVIEAIIGETKRIDILINNAGYAQMGPLIEMPEKAILDQFQTNVFSGLYLSQKVAPIMKESGGGLIINMGSISGIATTPFSGPYCASKAALHAFSDALRMELAPFNIKVLTVQPGGIKSALGETSNKKIEEILMLNSWYKSVKDFIMKRATASQEHAMSAEVFAKRLVNRVLRGRLRPFIRIGRRSFTLPFMKHFLPVGILDTIMSRKFGLDRL